jgi:hypothetical protein
VSPPHSSTNRYDLSHDLLAPGTTQQLVSRSQQYIIRNNIGSKLTVNAALMVTMLVRTACISSSKISFCQGVSFQSNSHRGNLRLDEDQSSTCAPDIPGPFDAWSIWAWSLTKSSSAPPSITLMGSTSMTQGEADVPTSPTTPCAPASAAGGGVAVLESASDGRVTPLHQ